MSISCRVAFGIAGPYRCGIATLSINTFHLIHGLSVR